MKADEYIYIENLLERFFEGETTNAEEQELYAFFARPDLPEHLKNSDILKPGLRGRWKRGKKLRRRPVVFLF